MEISLSSLTTMRGKVAYQVVVTLIHRHKEYPEAQPEVELLGVYRDKKRAEKVALKELKKRSKSRNWEPEVSIVKVKVVE
jgi:hypothetical protein